MKNKRILLAEGKQQIALLVAQNIRKALEMCTFEICNFLGFGFFFFLLLTEMVQLNCIFGVGYQTVLAPSMLKQKLAFNVGHEKY